MKRDFKIRGRSQMTSRKNLREFLTISFEYVPITQETLIDR